MNPPGKQPCPSKLKKIVIVATILCVLNIGNGPQLELSANLNIFLTTIVLIVCVLVVTSLC